MTQMHSQAAARQLGRMVAQAIEIKSPQAPAAPVVRSHATDEVMRLPPDVRRVVASLLSTTAPEGFDADIFNYEFEDLEVENDAYEPGEVFISVERIRCTDPYLGDLLASGSDAPAHLYATAADPLGSFVERQRTNGIELLDDEHYLERRFLVEVFIPTLLPDALSLLEAQAPFEGDDGKKRRIDFVLKGRNAYAVELEGYEFHDRDQIGRTRFADEKARQRDLMLAGFSYTPFSFDEIASGNARQSFRQLCSSDDVLREYLRSDPEEGASATPATAQAGIAEAENALFLFRELPAVFRDLQYYLLAQLVTAIEEGDSLVLLDQTETFGIVGMVTADLWTLADRCVQLYGIDLELPHVVVETTASGSGRDPLQALTTYYANSSLFENSVDLRLDREPVARVQQVASVGTRPPGAPEPTVVFSRLSAPTEPGAGSGPAVRTLEQVRAMAMDARRVLLKGPAAEPIVDVPEEDGVLSFQGAKPGKRLIDYFARRYFGIASIRRPQYETILRTLRGDSSFVLIATGGGKSLCYQLSGLLMPGLTLVISPLRALIRDQLAALGGLGISAVGGTTSDDTPDDRAALMRGLDSGRYRLLYVSPERIQIKSFIDEFVRRSENWNIRAIAVDEAHCVSEWGHDFRPSYLAIPNFVEAVAERSQQPALLALTATASRLVLEDVVSTLRIPPEGVITYGSVDRPELSLSVHSLAAAGTEVVARNDVVVDLIGATLDHALGMETGTLTHQEPDGTSADSAVVFSIFANPHGRHTTPLGVAEIASAIRDAEVVRPNGVRVHASTQVTVCPECATHRFWSEKGELVCEEGHRFSRDGAVPAHPDWNAEMRRNQDDFKANRFPVLVATKGYGMGIDKRNIRAVVHTTYSSGLESYYQEIGRSGRDGQHAHAALIFQPPTDECREEYLTLGTGTDAVAGEPPCVSQDGNYQFWRCPFGLQPLCDYGLQARFIRGSYPSVNEDLEAACEVMNRVIRQAKGGQARLGPFGDRRLGRTEIALYRLAQLGLVGDHLLEYRGLSRAYVQVDVPEEPSFEEVLDRASSSINRLRRGPPSRSILSSLESMTAEREVGDASPLVGATRPMLRALIEETYRAIKGMRYEMLHNLLVYSENRQGTCRRLALRAPFDSPEQWTGDHRCEFCDTCVPDLDFKRERAVIHEADFGLSEVARRLPGAMEVFDVHELDLLIATAQEHDALATLQSRVEHSLESDPGNPSARLLAGRAALQRAKKAGISEQEVAYAELTRQATRHLVPAFQEGERRGLSEAQLTPIYDELAEAHPGAAIESADRSGGVFDSPRGHRRLARDLTIFGDQDRARTMTQHAVLDSLVALDHRLGSSARDRLRRL